MLLTSCGLLSLGLVTYGVLAVCLVFMSLSIGIDFRTPDPGGDEDAKGK